MKMSNLGHFLVLMLMIPNPILIPILALTVFRCVSPARQINSRWSRHPNPSSSSNTITTILPQKCSTREERARTIVVACGVVGGLSLMLGSVARMEAGGAAFSSVCVCFSGILWSIERFTSGWRRRRRRQAAEGGSPRPDQQSCTTSLPSHTQTIQYTSANHPST